MKHNKMTIIGNLARDPEIRTTGTGKKVANFVVGVNTGRDTTTWVKVAAWENRAELVANYLHKGSKVLVEGTFGAPEMYTNKAGQPAANLVMTMDDIEFLGGNAAGGENAKPVAAAAPRNTNYDKPADDDDDPFGF